MFRPAWNATSNSRRTWFQCCGRLFRPRFFLERAWVLQTKKLSAETSFNSRRRDISWGKTPSQQRGKLKGSSALMWANFLQAILVHDFDKLRIRTISWLLCSFPTHLRKHSKDGRVYSWPQSIQQRMKLVARSVSLQLTHAVQRKRQFLKETVLLVICWRTMHTNIILKRKNLIWIWNVKICRRVCRNEGTIWELCGNLRFILTFRFRLSDAFRSRSSYNSDNSQEIEMREKHLQQQLEIASWVTKKIGQNRRTQQHTKRSRTMQRNVSSGVFRDRLKV